MEGNSLEPDKSSTGVFTKEGAASFHNCLKLHFVGFLVYPAVFIKNPNFLIKIGQVPPIMDPSIAGDFLLDTEFEVKLSDKSTIPSFWLLFRRIHTSLRISTFSLDLNRR